MSWNTTPESVTFWTLRKSRPTACLLVEEIVTGPAGATSLATSAGRACRTVTVYGSAVETGGAAGGGGGIITEVTTAASGPDAEAVVMGGPPGVAANVNVVGLGVSTT